MTPVRTIAVLSDGGPVAGSGSSPNNRVYVAAPGHYVSCLAGGCGAATSFDLIEVVVTHRGCPPARRYPCAMRYHVLEGQLRIITEDRDWLEPSATASCGQTYAVPRGVAHAVHNPGPGPVRFLIGSQPGMVDSYLAQFDLKSAAA
ncbi:MAG TPA: cupin domain-containing protein [Solirubrobacteraceae bacterium]|nr:cupin domain-containing protein [Solirubrobacteraceae bacterium]